MVYYSRGEFPPKILQILNLGQKGDFVCFIEQNNSSLKKQSQKLTAIIVTGYLFIYSNLFKYRVTTREREERKEWRDEGRKRAALPEIFFKMSISQSLSSL